MKKQESKHGRRGQSETRSPGSESHTSLPKPLPKIIFQQDFPKPPRPGHKIRSRPSILKPPAEGLRPPSKKPPPETPEPAPEKPQPVPDKPQPAPQKPQPATPAVPAGSKPTAPSQPKQPASAKAKIPEPEPSIWEKIFPCLKKEKPAPKEPLEKHLVAVAPPPKGPYDKTSFMVGDIRCISTVPSPPLPEAQEPKKKSKKKKDKKKTSSAHVSVPKTVFSIFDPIKEPAEVYIQEPSKLPKGILKTSEERVQPSKSVSIILPSEMDKAEAPLEGVVKPSKTHFKSEEISQVTSESSVQSLPQERKPRSSPPDLPKEKEEESSEEEEKEASPPPVSLKSQKKAPLFARTNVPPKRKANTKDSATQTVPPVESIKPASPLISYSLPESPSPTVTPPRHTEKMACRLPAAHFQLELAPSYIPPPKHGPHPPASSKAEGETEPTKAAVSKPPKPGARGAPLPGAKWVHKFLF